MLYALLSNGIRDTENLIVLPVPLHTVPCDMQPVAPQAVGALGRNRTCDLRFRKPLLYPLSYEGGDGAKCGAKFADTPCVIYVEVTGVRSEWKECAHNRSFVFVATDLPAKTHLGRQRTNSLVYIKRC